MSSVRKSQSCIHYTIQSYGMINWRMALTFCIHLDSFSKRGSLAGKRMSRTIGRKKQNLSYSTGHFSKSAEPLTVIPNPAFSRDKIDILNITFNSTFSVVLDLPSSPSILKANDIFSFHTTYAFSVWSTFYISAKFCEQGLLDLPFFLCHMRTAHILFTAFWMFPVLVPCAVVGCSLTTNNARYTWFISVAEVPKAC